MKLIENYSPSNLSPKTGGGNVLLDHLLTIVYPHSNDKIEHIAIVSPFECIRKPICISNAVAFTVNSSLIACRHLKTQGYPLRNYSSNAEKSV